MLMRGCLVVEQVARAAQHCLGIPEALAASAWRYFRRPAGTRGLFMISPGRRRAPATASGPIPNRRPTRRDIVAVFSAGLPPDPSHFLAGDQPSAALIG